ncbi:MAG: 3-phosphoshikimate 1-carboxyvinyltransferase [Firmicutes bacterium]|nr:3-phosphoshikimate 1-carboxyvinyltransferase [Bacillota bacterium]
MEVLRIRLTDQLQGEISVPGDKSISHRAVMLGALAEGETRITNFLASDDCLRTAACMQHLGIEIEFNGGEVVVYGRGLEGLSEPDDLLDVGNSGTTIRLMSGILAGQSFSTFISGDASIRRRPMDRITKPLRLMGAEIIGRDQGNLAPLAIRGGNLKPITYRTEVASAQVKSAILLAGLFCDGWTEVIEPAKSRDHTEIMLQAFGVPVEVDDLSVRVRGKQPLQGCEIAVPGDLSSAAYFITAACLVPNADLFITNVGLNPSRTGIIDILTMMGADIQIVNQRRSMGELVGDLRVKTSRLKGVTIGGELVVRAIDEIPVLAVAAAFADGVTEIRDAAELKVKESNRIAAIAAELHKLGADVSELSDGIRIKGGKPLTGAVVSSHHDHRIALALAVAALRAEGETQITNADCISVSYPRFLQDLVQIGGVVIDT